MTDLEQVRDALGRPGLSGHSGCEGGPYLKLHYDTVAEAYRAFEALSRLLSQRGDWKPRSMGGHQPHPFKPHPKYPGCAICGYAASERLMHPAAEPV